MVNHIIQVSRGSPAEIEAVIRAFESICQVTPVSYILKLYVGQADLHYVSIEGRMPGCHFNNLIGWLDSPPDHPTVGMADGWWAAGDEFWYVHPLGDNAIIVKPHGEVLMSYRPENAIYPSPETQESYSAPPNEMGDLVAEFSIAVENLEQISNPRNEITDSSEEELHARLRREYGRTGAARIFAVVGGFALFVLVGVLIVMGLISLFS